MNDIDVAVNAALRALNALGESTKVQYRLYLSRMRGLGFSVATANEALGVLGCKVDRDGTIAVPQGEALGQSISIATAL